MQFDNLTSELQEKAKACKNIDELVALAQEEGFELSDDDLEGIAGGRVIGFDLADRALASDCRKNMKPDPVA